ncbi:MAG: DUF805 domain-containing protein [Gemmatimonadetes bacterium]|nr:DUF805 domain-containing protein [Gemmatimonadota bacterium]
MFTGRIGRLKFLVFYVAVWLVGALAYLFALAIGSGRAGDTAVAAGVLVFLAGGLVAFLISLSAWVRRFHDLDQSGWMALLALVPFVNLVTFFVLLLAPGTPGPNRYGPEPGTARPAPYTAYAPPARPSYTPSAPPTRGYERPFSILAQGLDRSFRPNGSPEWVRLGSMTGSEFARRAAGLGPPTADGYVPNVAFDRDGVRLVLYQEDADVWHATDPPPGMTDRVAVHHIPDWLEAGVSYARRA